MLSLFFDSVEHHNNQILRERKSISHTIIKGSHSKIDVANQKWKPCIRVLTWHVRRMPTAPPPQPCEASATISIYNLPYKNTSLNPSIYDPSLVAEVFGHVWCQARTPSKIPSSPYFLRLAVCHHRIALPRASTPFKPSLNCNSDPPLSFATFHMLVALFVVELCSSK